MMLTNWLKLIRKTRKQKAQVRRRKQQHNAPQPEQLEERLLLATQVFKATFESGSLSSAWAVKEALVFNENSTTAWTPQGRTANSGDYGVELNGGFTTDPGRYDHLETISRNLAPYDVGSVKFAVKKASDATPSSSEPLLVEYRNSNGSWRRLDSVYPAEVSQSSYTQMEYALPANALHSNFRLRFRHPYGDPVTTGQYFDGGFHDNWWIDDLYIHGDAKPSISVANVSVQEGGSAALKIRLSHTTIVPVSVHYATSSDTAGLGDYYSKYGTVTLQPGQREKTVNVATKQDDRDEFSEQFFFDLDSPVNATIADDQAVVTITDDDPAPVMNISPLSQQPGTTGSVSEGNAAKFAVSLGRTSSRTITVNYTTETETASGDDLTSKSGTLTFSPGQTSAQIHINTTEDSVDELAETFLVRLTETATTYADINNSWTRFSIVDDDPTPQITLANAAAVEGDSGSAGTVTLTATLSNASSRDITVDYATVDGTAGDGSDYSARSSTLTFPAGSLSQSFTVSLLGDDIDEGAAEQFAVALTNPTNATVTSSPATVTITDDDSSPVADAIVTGVDYQIVEGDGLILDGSDTADADSEALTYSWDLNADGLPDSLSGQPTASFSLQGLAGLGLDYGPQTVPVWLTVSDGINSSSDVVDLVIGNAAPLVADDGDVVLAPEAGGILRRTVQFSDPGNDSHTITVDWGDGDVSNEIPVSSGERSLIISHGYTTPGQYTVTVDVNDGTETGRDEFSVDVPVAPQLPVVSFLTTGPIDSVEGDAPLTITASLSQPSSETVVVPLLASGFATESGDFSFSPVPVITFLPGATSASVDLLINDDLLFESSESATILMDTPEGAQLGDATSLTINIADNDVPPVVNFSGTLARVTEGSTYRVTAQLDRISPTDVIVPLSFSGAAAETTYQNYLFPGNQIVIPAGSLSAGKTLSVTDDQLAESAQLLLISMGSPVNAAAGDISVQTVLIPVNDTPVMVLRSVSSVIREDGGSRVVSVDLSNPTLNDVSVGYTLSGTATNGEDFLIAPDTPLTFGPGQTTATVDLSVIDDEIVDSALYESVRISFGQPSSGVLGGPQSYTLFIRDNDVQAFEFVSGRQTVWEDAGTVTLTVQANRPAETDVWIPLKFHPGTLTSGFFNQSLTDLEGDIPTRVLLPAGELQTSFSVDVNDDAWNESTESFAFSITNQVGTAISDLNTVHRVSIRDNDPYVTIDAEQSETPELTRGVDFIVRLSAATNRDVTVDYESYGTATLGSDYTVGGPGTVTIPAGETSARVTVQLKDDARVEGTETIGLKLTNPDGAKLAGDASRDRIQVRNDDVAKVAFKSRGTSVSEAVGSFTVKVGMSQALAYDVRVPIEVVKNSGRAILGRDYTFKDLDSKSRVLIKAGERSASFRVVVDNDKFIEDRESIQLKLGKPTKSTASSEFSDPVEYVIKSSDNPGKTIIYLTPNGLSLNQPAQAGNVAIHDGKSLGPDDYVLVETTAEGEQIVIPQSAVPAQGGQLPVLSEEEQAAGKTGSGKISLGSTATPLTLAILGDGTLAALVTEETSTGPTPASDILVPNASPLTIQIDLGSNQSNYFGSTIFFDANGNQLPDFVDLNGDGIQQAGEPTEPTAVTALDGTATLSVPYSMDVNGDGVISSADGRFVQFGGIDTATELPLPIRLRAAVGHYNISPASTLAAELVHSFQFTAADAEGRVASGLGVPGSTFANINTMAAAAAGDQTAIRLAISNAQVQTTAIGVASLFSAATGAPAVLTLGDVVYGELAAKLRDPNAQLDLSSEATIDALIQAIAFQTGLDLPSSAIDAAALTISTSNTKLANLSLSDPGVLNQRAKIEIVSKGQLPAALIDMIGGLRTPAEAIRNFTGSALQTRIDAATPGIITPPQVSITSFKTLEGDGEAKTLRYEVSITGDVNREVTVDYETLSGAEIDGEFTPVSGTLLWAIGDTGTKVIEVPFVGDTTFESDEAVVVALTSVSNAVLANDFGYGFMINDDALHLATDATTTQNDLFLDTSGIEASLSQNSENVFAGLFSEGVTSVLTGSPGVLDALTVTVGDDNQFLAGSLTYVGNDDGDVLVVNAETAQSALHRVTGPSSGEFVIDGRTISYRGVTTIVSSQTPAIMGIPAEAAEGDTIRVTSSLPDSTDESTTDFAWSLVDESQNVVVSASGIGLAEFEFAVVDDANYEIRLTATDGNGFAASISSVLVVDNVAPILTAIGNSTTEEGAVYTLNLFSDDSGDDTITEWTIDWGDGTAPESVPGYSSSVTHVYADGPAAFPISATATDEDGTWAAVAVPAEGAIAPDPSFGTDGVAQFDLTDSSSEYFRAMDIQPDGRIVAAGGDQSGFVLARFLEDGTLDTSFGTMDSDGIDGVVLLPNEQAANSIVVHPNGRIIVGAGPWLFGFDTNGTADNTFGPSAVNNESVGFFTQARDLVVDHDGGIIAAGYRSNYTNPTTGERTTDMIVARFTADGIQDSTFAANDGDTRDGVSIIDIGSGNGIRVHDDLSAVELDANGNIVVVGRGGPRLSYATLRYTPDGLLDPTFGAGPSYAWDTGDVIENIDGLVLTSLRSTNWSLTGVALDESGRIFTGGRGTMIGLLPDGTLDASFGIDGVVWDAGSVFRVLVDSEDHILTMGSDRVTRLRPDGTRDPFFGPNGQYTTNGVVGFTDAVLDSAGRIVGAGGFRPDVGSSSLTLGLQRFAPATLTVTVSNVAPSLVLNGPDTADEGQTFSYSFTTTDPGDDTFTIEALTAGSTADISDLVFDSTTGAGSFDVTFTNGPEKAMVAVRIADADGAVSADPGQTLPDARFGSTGTVITDIRDDGRIDNPYSLGSDSEGRLYVGGQSFRNSGNNAVVVRYLADGSPDPTFGVNGAAILSASYVVEELEVLENGKVLLRSDQRLTRLNADGSLDTSFGTMSGSYAGSMIVPFTVVVSNDAIVVTDDGGILVVGTESQGTIPANGGTRSNMNFALARFDENGVPDGSFGTNGVLQIDLGDSEDRAQGMISDVRNGREQLIIFGTRRVYDPNSSASTTDFTVARINPDGTLDDTYANGFGFHAGVPHSLFQPGTVAVQSDGSIILVGSHNRDFAAMRLLPDGSGFDQTFGTDGLVRVELSSNSDYPSSVAIDDSGRIVLAGSVLVNNVARMGLVRLNPDGTLDPSFGEGGIEVNDLTFAKDLLLQGESIVATGGADDRYFGVVRYAPGHITVRVDNTAPELTISESSVAVMEGDTAHNSGSFADAAADMVSITADFGTITQDDSDGTWEWIYDADDDLVRTVTVTALDNEGASTAVTFELTVNNVAPTATVGNTGPVDENSPAIVSLTSPVDPSTADATALRYSFALTAAALATDYSAAGTASSAEFTFPDNGTFTVFVRIYDDDGGTTDYTSDVTVNNVAPTITVEGADVTIAEGQTASNSGTFSDVGPNDIVTLTASLGTVSDNGDGTWSWSFPGADDLATTVVTVRASDDDDDFSEVTFDLTVNNVAATFDAGAAETLPTGSGQFSRSGIAFADDGLADVHTLTVDFGDGTGPQTTTLNPTGIRTFDLNHEYEISGTFTVTVSLNDGTITTANTFDVTVNLEIFYDFSSAVFTAFESDSATSSALVTVNRSGATTIPSTVDLVLAADTAVAGSDFTAGPIALSFDANELSKTVSIELVGDNAAEPTESLGLSFTHFSIGGLPGTVQPAAVLFIDDDDAVPVPVPAGPYVISEGNTLTLDASASTDNDDGIAGLTFRWDVDGDGDFDENVVGINPTLSVTELADLGLNDGPAAATVTLEATDGTNVNTAQVNLTVRNVAPEVTANAAAVIVKEADTATNAGTFSDPGVDIVTLSASVGSVIDNGDGTWSWSWDTSDGPDDSQTVTITATDDDGDATPVEFELVVNNVAPIAADATFELVENSSNGTAMGTVTATDPGNDTLTFSISAGNELDAFVINPATGEITVADATQLDFETTPVFELEVTVVDDDGATATADVIVNLLNQASLTGVVFVDTNQNGLFDANEMGIDGVALDLLDTDGDILDTVFTSDGGFYLFDDLDPGSYSIRETQPSGVDDGAESLGTLGGQVAANDLMEVELARIDGADYDFAELGQQLTSGDTAAIGFWQNKHGQALIASGGTALADWLTNNFGNIFGNEFIGADGTDVAIFYKDQLFKQKGRKPAGPAKVDARFMAVALSTFFTSSHLTGTVGADYGFNVTHTGIGTNIVNVGGAGDAFGVDDDTELTIMQLLLATNSMTDQPDHVTGFASIYDTNGDGVIDASEQRLRWLAHGLFASIT